MSDKPLIGVIPLMDYDRESYWMLPGYFKGIEAAGGVPLMLPLRDDAHLVEQLVRTCDGFLLTGGQDVSPEVYGEAPLVELECCPERDAMEARLVRCALEADVPLFGICRGIQFLNATLGGTLYQDVPTQLPSELEHHMSAPYDRAVHTVEVFPGTPLYELYGTPELSVNSYHHQGVCTVSPRLRPMAKAPDGLVEAVWAPEASFAWAVQWHPEFMPADDPQAHAIFNAFIRACEARRA